MPPRMSGSPVVSPPKKVSPTSPPPKPSPPAGLWDHLAPLDGGDVDMRDNPTIAANRTAARTGTTFDMADLITNGTATKPPCLCSCINIAPLSGAKTVLATDYDDVAIVRDIVTNYVFTYCENDGFVINITSYINASGRGTTGFGLDRLNSTWLTSSADGNFPGPVRMDFGISTG